jgi:hypothetical protein
MSLRHGESSILNTAGRPGIEGHISFYHRIGLRIVTEFANQLDRAVQIIRGNYPCRHFDSCYETAHQFFRTAVDPVVKDHLRVGKNLV